MADEPHHPRQTGDGIVHVVLLSVMMDTGEIRQFDLHQLASLQILDAALRRDLDYYLRTQLSATWNRSPSVCGLRNTTPSRMLLRICQISLGCAS